MPETQCRPPLAIVRDPQLTTPRNLLAHLRGSDAVGTITVALEGIGLSREDAHTHALACVQRTNRELTEMVVFHCAEQVWRATVGDVDEKRSLLAYAESCEAGRDTLAKLLRDVREVMNESQRFYAGAVNDRERTRAASHAGRLADMWPSRTLQAKANAIVARMQP